MAELTKQDPSRVDPRSVSQRAASPLATTGVSGTVVIGGYVQDNERQSELTGQNRYRTFSNILANVSIVAAGTRYFLNLVSRPMWRLEPPPLPGAERLAELAQEMMYSRDMATPWHRVVRRAATYRLYGFSVQEMTALRREDGLIGMADISPRPQSTIERWDVDEQGRVYGIVQRSPTSGRDIYLPRDKVIYVVDDSLSDSPEGLGLLRQVAESARRLRVYEQIEGWGFETDLRGVPVGRAPLAALQEMLKNSEITQADYDRALAGMRDFLQNHIVRPDRALMLDSITYEDRETRKPSGERKWDFELLKSDGNSHAEILRAIDRMNREIARVLGVEQLLLGDNGGGSYAMAKEKSHNFAIQVDSTLEQLRETFEKDWLGFVWRLNGWPAELMPEIKVDRLQFRDVDQVTGSLERLARAGAPLAPGDPAVEEIRAQMGLSRPIVIEDPLATAPPAAADDEEEPAGAEDEDDDAP